MKLLKKLLCKLGLIKCSEHHGPCCKEGCRETEVCKVEEKPAAKKKVAKKKAAPKKKAAKKKKAKV